MFAVVVDSESAGRGSFPQRLKLWLEDWPRSRTFPELSGPLKDTLKVAENGVTLYDSVRRFEAACEHPNKQTVFKILDAPVRSASGGGAQFLLDYTSHRALSGAPGPNFVAGAVRSLLARKEESPEARGELFLAAAEYFMRAETYTEALGTCILASKCFPEPRASALREGAQKILLESILQMEDLGLSINAVLKLDGMLNTLIECGVLTPQEGDNLRFYMQRSFSNLG